MRRASGPAVDGVSGSGDGATGSKKGGLGCTARGGGREGRCDGGIKAGAEGGGRVETGADGSGAEVCGGSGAGGTVALRMLSKPACLKVVHGDGHSPNGPTRDVEFHGDPRTEMIQCRRPVTDRACARVIPGRDWPNRQPAWVIPPDHALTHLHVTHHEAIRERGASHNKVLVVYQRREAEEPRARAFAHEASKGEIAYALAELWSPRRIVHGRRADDCRGCVNVSDRIARVDD
eukprot:3632909-Prymnesium_polylepis.1